MKLEQCGSIKLSIELKLTCEKKSENTYEINSEKIGKTIEKIFEVINESGVQCVISTPESES